MIGFLFSLNRKHDLILIMTTEKQDKTLELSKHWSVDSTLAGNEVFYPKNSDDFLFHNIQLIIFLLTQVNFIPTLSFL